MKPLLLLVLLLPLAAAAQSPNAESTSKKEECSIAGMVVKLAGSEPLRKARVLLTSADDQSRSISVTSDAGGSFAFKGLPAPMGVERVASPMDRVRLMKTGVKTRLDHFG